MEFDELRDSIRRAARSEAAAFEVELEAVRDVAIREFNTGRPYSVEGQIIRWWSFAGQTAFFDVTRDICGIIDVECVENHQVMRDYDAGSYEVASSRVRAALRRPS